MKLSYSSSLCLGLSVSNAKAQAGAPRAQQSFVANTTGYTLYGADGEGATWHMVYAIGERCLSGGPLLPAARLVTTDKWLADDENGLGYQLWTERVDTTSMQLCLMDALPAIAATNVSRAQLVRTFVANDTSYGLYAEMGIHAGMAVLQDMQRDCSGVATVSLRPAPKVPKLITALDLDGDGFELWTEAAPPSPMQACLTQAMQDSAHKSHLAALKRDQEADGRVNLYVGLIFGFTFGLIPAVTLTAVYANVAWGRPLHDHAGLWQDRVKRDRWYR